MIKGYDVSNVNGPQLIIPGDAEFAIAKVSQDATFRDREYVRHRATARQREIGFGGYHYGDPNEQPNAEVSCNFYLDLLGDQQDGEIGALDVEINSGSGGFTPHSSVNRPWVLLWGKTFIRLKKYKPKLYISQSGITDFNLNTPEIPEVFDLWYAWWPDNKLPDELPPSPSPFREAGYKLWQYNADTIDKNVFLGTLDEFRATGKPSSTPVDDGYEVKYWTPMQKLIDDLVAHSPPRIAHADSAFHAAISNTITLHKIAVGEESSI